MKKALISGVTGQDGAYLAELLLSKGYEVHGIKRRSSSFNSARIDHLYQDPHETGTVFKLHYGDLTDSTNLIRLIQEVQPDEIYNLAAQSHVQVSFETPEYTANADGIGTLRLLEGIRILKSQIRNHKLSSQKPAHYLRIDRARCSNLVGPNNLKIWKSRRKHGLYDAVEKPVGMKSFGRIFRANGTDDKELTAVNCFLVRHFTRHPFCPVEIEQCSMAVQ